MSDVLTAALAFAEKRFDASFTATDAALFEGEDGAVTAYLQQVHREVPVHLSRVVVRVEDGRASEVSGRALEVPDELSVVPSRAPVNAADLALREAMGSDEGRRPPKVEAQFSFPTLPTVLRRGDLGAPIRANLVVAEVERRPRLCWHVRWETASREAWESLVTADEGDAVIRSWRVDVSAVATASVFRIDPDTPREQVRMPLPRDEYPWQQAWLAEEPRPWIKKDATSGNNAATFEGALRRVAKAGVVAGELVFETPEPQGVDQRRVNAFFLCSWLHDLFQTLGFTEARGNFQEQNFGRTGKANDEVRIEIANGFGPRAAGMLPARDGIQPRMLLYLDPTSGRHTALDAHVVVHEYTHAVSDRLIGGPGVTGVFGPGHESQALNEGFSDYFAMSIVNRTCSRLGLPPRTVFAPWASGDPSGYRPQPYDGSLTLRHADVVGRPDADPHHTGQVWCQILLNIESDVVAATPHQNPQVDAWRLVFNLMCDLAPRPTFADCRRVLGAVAARSGWSRADLQTRPATLDAITNRFDEFGVP